MLRIVLDPDLDARLDRLARETGRSKSFYICEAIRQFLDDCEDYLKAFTVLERHEPTITLQELERKLGIDG